MRSLRQTSLARTNQPSYISLWTKFSNCACMPAEWLSGHIDRNSLKGRVAGTHRFDIHLTWEVEMMHGRCTPTPWRGKTSFFSFWRLVAHCVLNLIVFLRILVWDALQVNDALLHGKSRGYSPWVVISKEKWQKQREERLAWIHRFEKSTQAPLFWGKGIQHGSIWPSSKVWWTSWRQWVVALILGELRASLPWRQVYRPIQ